MKLKPLLPHLALFAGVLLGFCGAVFLGEQAVNYSKPSHFKRFHPLISPEGSFYPSFAMMENLAVARWSPGKTVVIIGGNSILNGVGQSESELWSEELQRLIGSDYIVVNLSMRGAGPAVGAALVVESLIRRHIPVLYVANTGPGAVARAYTDTYGYFYWDATARDRLILDPGRLYAEREIYALMPASAQSDLDAQRFVGRLNASLHFQELWQHVAYRHIMTVWNPVARAHPWQARDAAPDSLASAPPMAQRFQQGFDHELGIVRSFTSLFATPTSAGGWQIEPVSYANAGESIDSVFPAPVLRRTILILSQNCPYYRQHLTAAELARDNFVFAEYEKLWREHAADCITVGADFSPEDYFDRTHLAASGGVKMARLVAGRIRQLRLP